MEKVAVWDKFINLRYILPVLLGLGEEAVYHCGPQLVSARPEVVAELKAAGVEVVVGDHERAMSHKYCLMDSGNRLYMDLPARAPATGIIRQLEARGARFINVRTEVTGPNIFQVSPEDYQDGDLTFLMRFAADLNLVGLFSGSFITNVMIGLPTLPVYTRTIQAALPPRPFNYTVFLRNNTELCTRLAHGLAPMDIEATETIIDRLGDKDYWERYENELPQLRQLILGDFQLGQEALDRTVFFIRRVLRVNSFNPSSLPPGGSIKDGPLQVGGGLCPIML